ncbi:signal peptidase II [Demequina lignilytica]|uniref:Lipoprotein signal peptidase n=1 Tax=Demequina lignilytica TaxID=3051663 RepID=A0AAW7M765_9MICO|nr:MULTISPECIES: signal peptidase II [unclassified Demequina]MDN4477105.1 signal peptidase II [Demequina sp. SYSU T00039-1]MDN4483953.1 signal peptidase II [Demequina sp. SYSU T0a273]MDN4487278.1 signal peptidase II [Demequina sp. SYSU T00039]MDN4491529.1 signal peptidase II [Demequina sp. SYSU T00068]
MTWRPAFWLIAGSVVAIDQATKQWVLETLEPGEKHEVLGDLLSIQLVFNSGAAFSLGNAFTWILTLVAVAVSVGIVVYARRAQSTLAVWIFGAALGGALGNLIDRLFRDPAFGEGHVVDFINYGDLFVGNVADIAIVGAAIVLILASLGSTPVLAAAVTEDDAAVPADDATDDSGDGSGEARA